MNNCLCCSKETNNPKFCSSKCAATITNTNRPKKQIFCKCCNKLIGIGYKYQRSYCDNCQHKNKNIVDWSKITLKEYFDKLPLFQAHARIRALARASFRKFKPNNTFCQNCNYSKHVEVCHKKAISSFNETESIASVNTIDNLIALCPNCHWEFDNGILNLN